MLYAVNFSEDRRGPDFSWLKNRNMSGFVRPGDPSTTLMEPVGSGLCGDLADKLRLLVVVFSAPEHWHRREVIRKTWGKDLLKLPGVKVFFHFGKSRTVDDQVTDLMENYHSWSFVLETVNMIQK